MKTRHRPLLAWLLALGLAGCYPESEKPALHLSVPLSDMGLAVQEQALGAWLDWLDFDIGWDSGAAFEMNKDDKTFFLSLGFFGPDAADNFTENLTTGGLTISYVRQTDELIIEMLKPAAEDEILVELSIFWIDEEWGGGLQTFEASEIIDLLADRVTEVALEAQQMETGSVRVLFAGAQLPATAAAAVRDGESAVRFPTAAFYPSNDGPVALIEDLPLGRDLFVEFRAADSEAFVTQAAIRLEEADLVTTIEVEP